VQRIRKGKVEERLVNCGGGRDKRKVQGTRGKAEERVANRGGQGARGKGKVINF
jgi:hypothetical protein